MTPEVFMANMQNKSDTDLQKLLIEKQETLRNFRFNIAGTKTRNVKEGRTTRKEIARILTELKVRKQT